MYLDDLIKHLEAEGCCLDTKLSTKEVNIILHPYWDSIFISIPKNIPDLDWFEIVRICDTLQVNVPPECEDFREVYYSFLDDFSKMEKPWNK